MSDLSKMTLERRRETMSALADGRDDVAASAFALWASDDGARAAWHEYHLIGDVLRSEDLAHPAAKDARFLEAFKARLDGEPVVLAPAPSPTVAQPQTVHTVRRWVAPAAVAAGFMAVAAVLVVTQVIAPTADSAAVLATSASPAPTVAAQSLVPGASARVGERPLQLVEDKLIRDAQLDAYLRAHNGGTAVLPGRVTGRFEAVVLER